MSALVWVDNWQVQGTGNSFAVGQHVTWPISDQLNAAALTEHVGAVTAARISMAVDWYARQPADTVIHTGQVMHIERYRCRHSRGHVVPGTVEALPVPEADGWEPETGGRQVTGYLVTLEGWVPVNR